MKSILAVLAMVLIPASAFAVDGVVLINQSSVIAAGGFPYTITQPGSYKLSGNLFISDINASGIVIATDNVTIDLNGFSMIGPNVCAGGFLCGGTIAGTGHGIRAGSDSPTTEYFNITIRNGTIQGMGADAIHLLGDSVLIENVRARHNLLSGIVVRSPSGSTSGQTNLVLYHNTIQRNGSYGIKAYSGLITENTISESGNSGISVQAGGGGGGVVARNVVSDSVEFGLSLRPGVSYTGNTLVNNALGQVVGGVNLGQNLCNNVVCPGAAY